MFPRSLVFLLLAACPGSAVPPAAGAPLPDLVMEQVTVRQIRGDEATLVVRAPHLEMMRSSGEVSARDAGLFLPVRGVEVSAHSVTGNLQSGHVEARGEVVLTARDGLQGRSPFVIYERKVGESGSLSSDAGVTLKRPGFLLTADGFTMDMAEERADFTRPSTRIERAQ